MLARSGWVVVDKTAINWGMGPGAFISCRICPSKALKTARLSPLPILKHPSGKPAEKTVNWEHPTAPRL
jgi:hypothetical protein